MPSAGTMAHRPVQSFVPVSEVIWDPGFPSHMAVHQHSCVSRALGWSCPQDKTMQRKVSELAWLVQGKVKAFPLPVCLPFLPPVPPLRGDEVEDT